MNIVIRGVASNHQADGRDMETGRIICIGMSERNTHQLRAFKLDDISGEFLRNCEVRVDLPRKTWTPKRVENGIRGLLAHNGDHLS